MEIRITFYKDQEFLQDYWYSGQIGSPARRLGKILLCDEAMRTIFGNKLPQEGKFILVISSNAKVNYSHVRITKWPNLKHWRWSFLGEEGKTLQEHVGVFGCFAHSEKLTRQMLKKITQKKNLPKSVDLWLRVESCS